MKEENMSIYGIFTETLMLIAVLNPFGNTSFCRNDSKYGKETRDKLLKPLL